MSRQYIYLQMLQGKKCLEISIFESWNKYLLLENAGEKS